MMNKITMIGLVALCTIALSPAALAYSDGVGDTSLERMLAAKKAVEIAKENAGAGSGTPYFALDGVAGASAISAAVFGGIGAMFFLKGRNGRYVAQGRG